MPAYKLDCKSFLELNLIELYKTLQLRQEVFIVEQNCPYLDADDKDQLSHHIIAKNSEDIICGYTRIVPPGLSYEKYSSIGRVIIAKKERGKKLGQKIMTYSMEKTKLLFPDHPIKISAQVYILEFYKQLGFQAIGEAYLEDNIPHKAMIFDF